MIKKLPLWLDLVLRDFAVPSLLSYDQKLDRIYYVLDAGYLSVPLSHGIIIDLTLCLSAYTLGMTAWDGEGDNKSEEIVLDLNIASFYDFKQSGLKIVAPLAGYETADGN